MDIKLKLSALFIFCFAIACSKEAEIYQTVVKGTITVADSLDESGDFSGIEITILSQPDSGDIPDTLMNAITNEAGDFEHSVEFPRKQYYWLGISRNGNHLGDGGVILSENDTLWLNAELPDLEKTLTLKSREHEAMDKYNQVGRNFERVSTFIQAGAVPDSVLAYEMDKWSNIFWELYEKYPNTVASYLAAERSAILLSGWQDEKMLERIESTFPADHMVLMALRFAKPYIAENKGFDAANNYLNSLDEIAENNNLKKLILQEKIKMHYDSSRIQQAKSLLANYEKKHSESQNSQEWIKRVRYDLNYLSPGIEAPEFEFISLDGDTISNETLKGNVFILEISPLASLEYQDDLDRTFVIHEIYKNSGLKIVTIPLDNDPLTVDAFFEEREKIWPFAKVGSFDHEKILKKFNITGVPTRFLIDENGVMIRKYVRGEFKDVIEGLNRAFQNNNAS